MSREDAEKLCKVLATADGGCSHCVDAICVVASETFPEWTWVRKDGGKDWDTVIVKEAA